MLPATVARVAAHPGIVGIKEATGDLSRSSHCRRLRRGFLLLSGDDATCRDSSCRAGRASFPSRPMWLRQSWLTCARRPSKATRVLAAELDSCLADLHRDLFVESNPIPVKWALERLGPDSRWATPAADAPEHRGPAGCRGGPAPGRPAAGPAGRPRFGWRPALGQPCMPPDFPLPVLGPFRGPGRGPGGGPAVSALLRRRNPDKRCNDVAEYQEQQSVGAIVVPGDLVAPEQTSSYRCRR